MQRLAKIFEDIAAGERRNELLLTLLRDTVNQSLSHILRQHGSLGNFLTKRLLWRLTQLILAVNFGRRVRNLVGSDAYKDIFPTVELQAD
jgi:hypothetical protein